MLTSFVARDEWRLLRTFLVFTSPLWGAFLGVAAGFGLAVVFLTPVPPNAREPAAIVGLALVMVGAAFGAVLGAAVGVVVFFRWLR